MRNPKDYIFLRDVKPGQTFALVMLYGPPVGRFTVQSIEHLGNDEYDQDRVTVKVAVEGHEYHGFIDVCGDLEVVVLKEEP